MTTCRAFENIPQELRQPPLWVQYYLSPDPKNRDKKPRKHPCVKYATPDDRKANLRTLDYLLEKRTPQKGVQRYIEKSEGFTYVDIDHARNSATGEIEAWAQAIIDELDTYCEISASGTGFHLVCRATLPEDFHQDPDQVEIYAGNIPNKLIAITGELHDLHTTIESRQAEAEALLRRAKAREFNKQDAASGKEVSEQAEEGIVFGCMADVKEQPIEWLWPNRIPLSAMTVFTGNPDTGKTLAYCDLAARVSTEKDYPDAKMPKGVCGEVLMLCAEDDYSRVIKPRLMACGADTKSIYYIEKVVIRQGARADKRMFAFDTDLHRLEAALEDNHLCSLIIIDPISSYFGKGSMNDKQDVRAVFNRLTSLCEKYRVAIVAVEHFNKRVDVSAIHKMGGSVAIVAAARAAFMFAKVPDEEGQYVMHFVKGNLAKRKVGLRFTIGEKQIGSLGGVPYVVWGGEDSSTADDLLRAEKGASEDNRAARAANFIREYLTEEKPSDDVEDEAKRRGISRSAFFEARKQLGIRPRKRGGVWYCQPPSEQPNDTLSSV
jgi:hypothetical protein